MSIRLRNEDIVGQAIVEGATVLYPMVHGYTITKGTIVKEKRGKVQIRFKPMYSFGVSYRHWVSPKRCLITSY